MIRCPECGSNKVWKNGKARLIKQRKVKLEQRYLCQKCLRTFVDRGSK